MNPYREPPPVKGWSVTFTVWLSTSPSVNGARFGNVGSYDLLLKARSEDDAVEQGFRSLEKQGFTVLACTDAHPVFR